MISKMAFSILIVTLLVKSVFCDISNSDGTNEFRADYTYYPEVGYWFKAHPTPVGWRTARLLCHFEGAELASPLNAKILATIQNIVATHEPKLKVYYSGVHQLFGIGVYTSIEGVPLEKLFINNWAEGEPNGVNEQQCLTYSDDRTIWDYNCHTLFPYICYRKYSESDKLTECGTIDKEYRTLNQQSSHCYKYHKRAETWDRAQKICRMEGGYLAIINSVGEAEDLKQLMRSSPRPLYTQNKNKDTVALGFREWGQADSWWTIHGQTLAEAGFESWCDGCPDSSAVVEPNTPNSAKQACGGFTFGKLDAIYCDKPYAFICEKTKDSLLNTTSSSDISGII